MNHGARDGCFVQALFETNTMRITRIDLTCEAGNFAIVTRRSNNQRIDVEVLTPGGNRTGPTTVRRDDNAMARDYYAQQQLARRIQSTLDGYEGTEGDISEFGVEFLEELQRVLEVSKFGGRSAVWLDVVSLGVQPKAGDDLFDCDVVRLAYHLPTVGGPLGDNLVVLLDGFRPAELAKAGRFVVEQHDVPIVGGLMVAKFRNAAGFPGGGF